MEPITLCGAVIVVIGLWVEFESIIIKVARAISRNNFMTAIMQSSTEQKSVYVKYMTGT